MEEQQQQAHQACILALFLCGALLQNLLMMCIMSGVWRPGYTICGYAAQVASNFKQIAVGHSPHTSADWELLALGILI